MELIHKILPASHNLFLFGDTHLGSQQSHEDGIRTLIDMMHSDYDGCSANYGVHHGDVVEGILINDPRYRPDNAKLRFPDSKFPTVSAMVEDAIETLKPIRGKLIVIHMGNHEDKLWMVDNVTKLICKGLSVPYGSMTSKITLDDKRGRKLYKVFCSHGRKSINSTADDITRRTSNMALILKRHLKEKAGDCAIMTKGHTHKLLICEPERRLYLRDDGQSIKQGYTQADITDPYIHPDDRWYVNTGSFLKLMEAGTTTYGERSEYDPVELGFAVVRVRDRKIEGIDKVTV